MSITKSYTTLALGRAMQLGLISMDDLQKPVLSFLKDIDRSQIAKGADKITLHQALHMKYGIRVDKQAAQKLMRQPQKLKGQEQIQSYMELSQAIPPSPEFKYQGADPSMIMQV